MTVTIIVSGEVSLSCVLAELARHGATEVSAEEKKGSPGSYVITAFFSVHQ